MSKRKHKFDQSKKASHTINKKREPKGYSRSVTTGGLSQVLGTPNLHTCLISFSYNVLDVQVTLVNLLQSTDYTTLLYTKVHKQNVMTMSGQIDRNSMIVMRIRDVLISLFGRLAVTQSYVLDKS